MERQISSLDRVRAISSHLPENVEEWPHDPFRIVGVERTADRTTVRRAYSRLIREFRPESHPTHFQKLREAYEVVLSVVDGRSRNLLIPDADAPSFDFQQGVHAAASLLESDFSTETKGTEKVENADRTEIETIWRRFCDAPDVKFYHAVERLADAPAPPADSFLILYWVQRLNPAIDNRQHRVHWLIKGQQHRPSDSRFVELFLAELRSDSALCVDESTRGFADYIQRPESLAHYLSVRWDGIGRRASWVTFAEEIEHSRSLFGLDQTEQWVRLLITAYQIVSFSTDHVGDRLLKQVNEEIHSFMDLQLTLNDELETLDIWQLFRSQRKKSQANEVAWFVMQYRQSTPTETRLAVLDVVSKWIDRPRIALNMLTSAAADFPEAFWQFLHLVTAADSAEDDFEDRTIAREVAEFLPETYAESYAGMRFRILEFCRAECIGPRVFFHHLANVAPDIGIGEELLDTLRGDYPLFVSIQCIHLFLTAAPEDEQCWL